MIELGVLKVDSLTHLQAQLIPVDLRYSELLDISLEGGRILITPAIDLSCPFCGRVGTSEIHGRFVCGQCVIQLKKLRRRKRSGK